MGRCVDDDLALVADDEVLAGGDLTNLSAGNVPVRTDFLELLHVLRGHHGAHALLGLGGEDLRGGHVLGAQRHVVEVDLHATVTGGSQLGRGAGQARTAQVLDADDDAGLVQVQAALDEDLFCKRVTDLHGWELALRTVLEGVRCQHGHAANAVQASARAEEHHLVARSRGKGQFEILHLQGTHAQGVNQRVSRIGLVENGFTTNVGQAQAVAVVRNTVDNTGENALGIGGISRAETQLVHHGDGASAHGHDVADDAAHASGRALMRLHVRGVVVALNTEGHGVAVSDVDHTSVLTNASENLRSHLLGHCFTEVAQVRLGRLVGAMLRPHHGVHGQLGVGRTAAQNLADAGVLVVLEAQVAVGLFNIRLLGSLLNGVVVYGHGFSLFPFSRRRFRPWPGC